MAYRIRIERNYYGPRTERSYHIDPNLGWDEVRYATRDEAEQAVAALDQGTYHLAHNESERATYKVVRVR